MIKYFIFFLSLTITVNMAAGLTFAEKARLELERRREAQEIADANNDLINDTQAQADGAVATIGRTHSGRLLWLTESSTPFAW